MASDAPLPEDELSWSTDVEAAQWWVDGLEPWLDPGIRSTVPSGFEAVTRIFHPIEYNDGTIGSWSALAAANGRQAHSGMQWHAVATPAGQPVSLTIDHPLDPYVSEGHLPDPGSGPQPGLPAPPGAARRAAGHHRWARAAVSEPLVAAGPGVVPGDGDRCRLDLRGRTPGAGDSHRTGRWDRGDAVEPRPPRHRRQRRAQPLMTVAPVTARRPPTHAGPLSARTAPVRPTQTRRPQAGSRWPSPHRPTATYRPEARR